MIRSSPYLRRTVTGSIISGVVVAADGDVAMVTVVGTLMHDDVIKWKHFPRYWPFVRGIHRSPVNSPHKGQWRGALMFSCICAWIHGLVTNREAGDLKRHRAHYYVIVMDNHEDEDIGDDKSDDDQYK